VEGEKLVQALRQNVAAMRQALFAARVEANGASEPTPAAVERLVGVQFDLAKVCALAEQAGVGFGTALQELDVSSTLQKLRASIVPDVAAPAVEAVKDALGIMDPLIGDTWDEVAPFLDQEITALGDQIGEGMVLLQGFDLARQVMEHRLNEIAPDPAITVPEALVAKVRAKLVTEQERVACDHYLGCYAAAAEEAPAAAAQEPGDVLLF
jgi:hypothetical protein